MNIKIYHNPRCSKSRESLTLIQEKGHNPEIILYLESGLSKEEISTILNLSNLKPRDILRTKEKEYKDANLSDKTLSDEQIIDAIIKYPKLLERPVVIIDSKKAVITRPPEKVLELI